MLQEPTASLQEQALCDLNNCFVVSQKAKWMWERQYGAIGQRETLAEYLAAPLEDRGLWLKRRVQEMERGFDFIHASGPR